MKYFLVHFCFFLVLFFAPETSCKKNEKQDTPLQPQEVIAKIHNFISADDLQKAINSVNNAEFPNHIIYILNHEGMCLASSHRPDFIGSDLLLMKDLNGNNFIEEIFQQIQRETKGSFVISYNNDEKKETKATLYFQVSKNYIIVTITTK